MIGKKLINAAAGAAGAGEATYVDDVFSTYLYTGNGSTQVIENGINLGDINAGGSGFLGGPTTGSYITADVGTTINFGTSDDFTIEFWVYFNQFEATTYDFLFDTRGGSTSATNRIFIYSESGTLNCNLSGTTLASSSTMSVGNWYHVAIVRSSGTATMYLNGTSEDSASTSASFSTNNELRIGDYGYNNDHTYNTDGFVSNLRVVNGTAVYTSGFTPSTSALTAISGTELLMLQGEEPLVDNSTNSSAIVAYGSASAKKFGPFTAAESGEGGLVWIKRRNGVYSHVLYDTNRGVNLSLSSNTTAGNVNQAPDGVSAFDATGFSLNGNSHLDNNTTGTYASWTFRKAPKFFDVVTYTGDGSGGLEIAHNLGTSPGFILIKRTDSSQNWLCWHRNNGNTNQAFTGFSVNLTNAVVNTAASQDIATDTIFKPGQIYEANYSQNANNSGGSYVAYLFAHNDGDGDFGESGDQDIIKCGSFTTDANGYADVDLGFEPQWILTKASSSSDSSYGAWWLQDNLRGWPVRPSASPYLRAESSGSENSSSPVLTYPTATGFVFDQNNVGFTSETFIYIAIRRPHKPAESGTEVFEPLAVTPSSDASRNITVTPDLLLYKYRSGTTSFKEEDRLRGFANTNSGTSGKLLLTSSTAAESSDYPIAYTIQNKSWLDGAGLNGVSSIIYNFRRSPGFFDVVCYTGDGVNRTVSHNLGVAPEFIITKKRSSTSNWATNDPSRVNPWDGALLLNSSQAFTVSSAVWNDTAPTDTVFTVKTADAVNVSGQDYIAYLFATLPGVSKVGSYTGNGTSQTIDCGFSSGARFVLIKRTNAVGEWWVWDTARGIVSGNDPMVALNITDAEFISYDDIDPNSSGFIVNSTGGANINASGSSYIFLAIA